MDLSEELDVDPGACGERGHGIPEKEGCVDTSVLEASVFEADFVVIRIVGARIEAWKWCGKQFRKCEAGPEKISSRC
jgi:hypothetical protein